MTRVETRTTLTDTDRKLLIGLALTLALALVLGGIILAEPTRLARTGAAFTRAAVARGEELFAAHCATCHGPEGRGDGETPAPALNDRTFLGRATDADIQETISYGRPGTRMRAYLLQRGGPLGDQQIQDLVAFIRHWEATAEVLPTPTPQVDAEALYASRCVQCHGLTGQGTAALPLALRAHAYLDQTTAQAMRAQIREGKPAIGMPACASDLNDAQVDALVAFILGWREGLPPLVDGETLYRRYCAVCHGAEGEGTALAAVDLREAAARAQKEDLRRAIVQGRGAMPPWGWEAGGPLSDEQVEALVQALRRWGGAEPEPALPAPDAFRGAALFAQHCASCHGDLGEGGAIVERAINSAEVLDRTTPDQLRGLIETGIPGRAMPAFRGTLSEQDLRDLLALFQKWKWALLFQ
ncbi:MAG: c-type cytochrome [Anaerolineae bacterium]